MLANGVTYEWVPPEPVFVIPNELSAEGGTAVEIRGRRFQATTRIYFGDHEILGRVFVSSTRITGEAPPLDPGEARLALGLARLRQHRARAGGGHHVFLDHQRPKIVAAKTQRDLTDL